jgi:lipoprotein-releasing system permease protein
MKLPLSIAWKYLTFNKKDRSVSFMIRICFLGILIGTFSLMLTLIITNGFEKVIHEKIQGINSQAIISSPHNKIDDESIKNFLRTKFTKEIQTMSSGSIRQALIDHNKNQSLLFIKGVEPETEHLVSSIAKKVLLPVQSPENLKNLLKDNHIIIGYKTAKAYHLKIGSKVKLLIPEPSRKNKIFLEKKEAVVAGIFNVGLDEYDSNFAYASLDFTKKLFDEEKGVDQIALTFNNPPRTFFGKIFNQQEKYEQNIIQDLKTNLPGLKINTWKNLYPALVSSLKLEKYVMFFILALITLVASMNMISLLFMQIQQKRRDVAIFKAMGMPLASIKTIFLSIGMTITFCASAIGLGLAAIAGFFLDKYPFIELPDVYFVTHLPAKMDLEIFIVVFVATILLGFFATWIPSCRTKKINIAQVLRQE